MSVRYHLMEFLAALIVAPIACCQSEPAATLDIDTQNLVIYRHDTFDAVKFATDAGPTNPMPLRTFMNVTWIADVVAVNGSPAKGTLTVRGVFVNLSPNPAVGVGISDTSNSLVGEWFFDIQRADGVPVGTIVASGWAFGSRAPGSVSPGQGNLAVLGGTGAFLGMRGQAKETSITAGARFAASVAEDPSQRRNHGGRSTRYTMLLLPFDRPAFSKTTDTSGIFHADFRPVTASNPARRGELLVAAATGLGPTVPGKQPNESFPRDSLQEVASPVQLIVNGTPVTSSNQVGWPGTSGTYRIDFQLPHETAAGLATIQIVSAWIPGATTEIPVQ